MAWGPSRPAYMPAKATGKILGGPARAAEAPVGPSYAFLLESGDGAWAVEASTDNAIGVEAA